MRAVLGEAYVDAEGGEEDADAREDRVDRDSGGWGVEGHLGRRFGSLSMIDTRRNGNQ